MPVARAGQLLALTEDDSQQWFHSHPPGYTRGAATYSDRALTRPPTLKGGLTMNFRGDAVAYPLPSPERGIAGPNALPKRVVISSFDNEALTHYNGGGAAVIEMIATRLADQFDVTILTAGRRSASVSWKGLRLRKLPVAWAGPRAGQLLYHLLLPIAVRRIPHDLWIENFTPPFSTSFVPLFSTHRVIGLGQALTGVECPSGTSFRFT